MLVDSSPDARPLMPARRHANSSGNASQLQHVRVVAEKSLVGVVQKEDSLVDDLAGFVIKLLRGRAENRLEDGDQLRSELLNGGLIVLIWVLLVGVAGSAKWDDVQSFRMHS